MLEPFATHPVVAGEQSEEPIPVVKIIVHPVVARYVGVCQHPISP